MGPVPLIAMLVLLAQPKPPPAPPPVPPVPGQEAVGPRSYSQHALTKIRPGCSLRDDSLPPPAPELRGRGERRRDGQITTHFSRLAELDVLGDLADKNHNFGLAERVEEVRRKEVQRFRVYALNLRAYLIGARGGEMP